ncbi:MAG TPA: tripartite tricarboxylate transporter substrate binding protein [Xanthobacteraceae bacterium]|jgi:tripartite-type tricarboxylate transporter receptor subunit TctC
MIKKGMLLLALVGLGLVGSVAHGHAQAWPARNVKFIAPFAAGGTSDTLGRIAAEHLRGKLGQQFYVENRVGAGGMIGSHEVAAAPPDGYSFVISGIASHVIAPAFSRNPPYDGLRDFTHVAYLGGPPVVLVVHASLGVRSFKEFLDLAKRSPEGLNYVSSGVGTHGFLFAEDMARREHFKLIHVPYKGSNPAVLDLIAGHVKIGAMAWSSAVEQIRAGNVQALGVSSQNRLAGFPDVPTFRELGYPDLVAATWFSLSGPAKLPSEISHKLNAAVVDVMQKPEVQKQLAQDGIEFKPLSPEDFTKFVEAETARWAPVAKAIGPLED